tara:strand:- start:6212 stop:6439 length:228 start_codon:yes stop_codon:yes gene_type:complete
MTVKIHHCLRCGHDWAARRGADGEYHQPKICPGCRSPYWNRPREREHFIEEARKKKEYAEGIFQGFVVDPKGGKS